MSWISKSRKKFGNEAQQTVEQLALEKDLDDSGKRVLTWKIKCIRHFSAEERRL